MTASGRYTITDLPKSREYSLYVSPKAGEPYLFTSRRIDVADDANSAIADVEVVRGISFRVRVLDRETGKPLKGSLVYFPINPNNPFELARWDPWRQSPRASVMRGILRGEPGRPGAISRSGAPRAGVSRLQPSVSAG